MHISRSRDDRVLCKSSTDYTDTFLSQARPKVGQGSYHRIPVSRPWSGLLGMSWKCLGSRYVPGRRNATTPICQAEVAKLGQVRPGCNLTLQDLDGPQAAIQFGKWSLHSLVETTPR